MSASLPGIVVPSMGIDVGFFSTKYSLGRTSGGNGGNILVEQFPSLAPRNFGGSRQLPTAGRQDVVLVEAEPGVFHHVGKDVFDTVSSTASRAVVPDFSMSSAYKALFLGALYYAARHFGELCPLLVQELVVGLPLSTIYTHADALQTMAQGTHTIPCPGAVDRTTTVEVDKATVVAQPHGALISHVVQRHGSGLSTEGNTLVLDMGGGTFDWFVSRGIAPNYHRCGAVAIGALACATAVCKSIKAGLQDDPEIVARVDKALRDNADTVRIAGRDHKLNTHWPSVEAILKDALEQMLKSVGSLDNVETILLTGGGATLLERVARPALRDYAHMIQIDAEPIASNVRGFHAIAEFQFGRRG